VPVAQLVLLDSNFDRAPQVVAEDAAVLGNIERTSGLYITKTVYAMLLSLAVGVAGFPFPFLPRHLTLIGALTIGIPSFFLALAPEHRSVPAGFVSGWRASRSRRHARGDRDVPGLRDHPWKAGVSLLEAQTAAVMVLTWIGCWCSRSSPRPLNRPRPVADLVDGGVVPGRAPDACDAEVLRAEVSGRPGVAGRDRHRGDRVVVRAPVRAGGAADRRSACVP
jgi:hypothetical protein